MYIDLKPSCMAIRADSPSYTPGQTISSSVSRRSRRSLAGPVVMYKETMGSCLVPLTS